MVLKGNDLPFQIDGDKMSGKKTKEGFALVCSFIAKASANCQFDSTNQSLLLKGGFFVGTINGIDFDCSIVEICKNGIILIGVSQNSPLSKIYNLQNNCDMIGFGYNQITSLKFVDFEKED